MIHVAVNAVFLATLYVTVISLRRHLRRSRMQHYAGEKEYSPAISLFVPCKGVPRYFPDNIRSFVALAGPSCRLFLIVESDDDPALSILGPLAENNPAVTVIVAGATSVCGQKNHNLIEGIKAAGDRDDLYVFVDSDIAVSPHMLHRLVAPLAEQDITLSTGFRWLRLRTGTFGERVQSFMVALQWVALTMALRKGAWGGAMAIRRHDFEQMRVAEHWGCTAVDDSSISGILRRYGKDSLFVPECCAETDDTLDNVGAVMTWFKRQSLFVKYYLRPHWRIALGLCSWASLNIIAFPVAAIVAVLHPTEETLLLARHLAVFMILAQFAAVLMKRSGHDNHSRITWFLLSPLYMLFSIIPLLGTLFTNVIHWSGIAYHVDAKGTVQRVARAETSPAH